ncbi:MAG: hypothetical protein V2I33_06390 [Kangiellaceae bacterium]|jgi:outer membrane lipopolysaccharide assembly protein LptE/RlpB|nr:hypothetical protein [Kangiellaceae bacterium]
MNKLFKSIGLLITFGLLANCGFQLQGQQLLNNLNGKTVALYHQRLDGALYDQVMLRLKRSGVNVLELSQSSINQQDIASSGFQLMIDNEQLQQRSIVRDNTGRAFEFELRLTVNIVYSPQPIKKDRKALNEQLKRKEFRVYRTYINNNQQLVANDRQKQELLSAMRQQVATLITEHVAQNLL